VDGEDKDEGGGDSPNATLSITKFTRTDMGSNRDSNLKTKINPNYF